MTLDCLETLHANLGRLPVDVWVIDNASTDGSAEGIRKAYPDVRILQNVQNAGFGAANNQAMRLATGQFFLLLNSDAFVRPGAIETLLAYLKAHPDTAAVGPKLLNADGTLQCSCYRFPSPLRAWLENLWISALFTRHPVLGDYRRWPHDAEQEVDHVIGACMLVRREAFEQVGGFDEGFFMYSDEVDWERRMRDRGWRIGFTPNAEVVHFGGASGANEKARINSHFFESLDRYERKHHGWLGLLSFRLAMTVGCTLRALLWGCVYVAIPAKRIVAASKARLHTWLAVRQATHWRNVADTDRRPTNYGGNTGSQ